jgi:uncharacterized protein (TIGR00297 family)
MEIIFGFIFSFIITFAAYKRRSLSRSGFLAAVVLGTSIYFFGGPWFFSILMVFFISSSLLTKFKKNIKKKSDNLHQKGGNRDYVQVIANGGVGLLFALMFYIYKIPAFMIAFAVSFAEANADTWASEIGVLSKHRPISILTARPVENGISGGISTLGTVFALLGSLFISAIFAIGYIIIYSYSSIVITYTMLVLLLGFAGSFIDSLLGASLQAHYYCNQLAIITEKRFYNKEENKLIRGLHFFNNDVVNLTSNMLTSVLALLTVLYFL